MLQEEIADMTILAEEPGKNIKGYALREYASKIRDICMFRMIFTFADAGGSFSAVSSILDILPYPIILVFNDFCMLDPAKKANPAVDSILDQCSIMARYGNFTVFAIGQYKREGIRARMLFDNVGCFREKKPFKFLGEERGRIRTCEYGTIAEQFAQSMNLDLFKVMPFGFQDRLFICEFTDYFIRVIKKNSLEDIKHVFMVIGSGTTLISLFRAFKAMSSYPLFHCTIVGRFVDRELIQLECPGIKVVYYETNIPYRKEMTSFGTDSFGSEELNSLIPFCPHYDSKLLIGLREYITAEMIHINDLKDTMLLFVMRN